MSFSTISVRRYMYIVFQRSRVLILPLQPLLKKVFRKEKALSGVGLDPPHTCKDQSLKSGALDRSATGVSRFNTAYRGTASVVHAYAFKKSSYFTVYTVFGLIFSPLSSECTRFLFRFPIGRSSEHVLHRFDDIYF